MEDEITPSAPRRFLIDVEETMRIVLEQEDTDNKCAIEVESPLTTVSKSPSTIPGQNSYPWVPLAPMRTSPLTSG
jgi:hypothetical protein